MRFLKLAGIFVSSLVVIFLLYSYRSPSGAELTIVIKNIKFAKGKMQIGLYNKKENFPIIGKEYKTLCLSVDAKEISHTVKNLPPGEYAIAVYHDVNADGKCNANFFGIPTESFGFSNNIKPFLSAPSFDDTKFRIEHARLMTIKLQH